MEGDGEKKINLEVEDKLIDISLENDSLIASPIVDSLEDLRLSVTLKNTKQHEGYKLSGASSSLEVNNAAEVLLPKEQKHLFSESMERARPSLDWNSAFSTSAASKMQGSNLQGSVVKRKKEAFIRSQIPPQTPKTGQMNPVERANKFAKRGSGQGSMESNKSGLGYSGGATPSSTPPRKSSSLVNFLRRKR